MFHYPSKGRLRKGYFDEGNSWIELQMVGFSLRWFLLFIQMFLGNVLKNVQKLMKYWIYS